MRTSTGRGRGGGAATGALADAAADVTWAGGSGRGSVFEEQADSPMSHKREYRYIELPCSSLRRREVPRYGPASSRVLDHHEPSFEANQHDLLVREEQIEL